jgi:putative ABC transport system permease protein
MGKLFGIPIDQLTIILLALFVLCAAIAGFFAVRNWVLFKIAIRNIPRRRAQTALIVLGLMLAALLFSASLTTGDTLANSVRLSTLKEIGQVDVTVQAEAQEATGRLAYFDQLYFEKVGDSLKGDPEVDGVAPLVKEVAPVVALNSRQSEPQVDILGYEGEWMSGFDRLVDGQGNTLSLQPLTAGQVYISSELADKIDVQQEDTILLYLGLQPAQVTVVGIYADGAKPAQDLSVVMQLSNLQTLLGNEGKINTILITHKGDALHGGKYTDATISRLEPLLEGSGLKAEPVKQDALKTADEVGGSFTSIFLLFGQFSIAAGILLIFLIFVMLAAARKRELGIARAVGTQQRHVIMMFAFEGAMYALIAAAIGSLLGILTGFGMVRIVAVALGQADLELAFAFQWQSLVIAYTLGMVITFAVVIVSSWIVSRLNIVRAIRDIPEPRIERKNLRGLILAILIPVVGLLLAINGFRGEQLAPWMLGTSLIIIGLPLLGRRFGLPERAAYTMAGLGLVIWWLLPPRIMESVLPDMAQGMEMFFISGIMLVIGAVWTIMYNSDILLAAILRLFSRIPGLAPVLKTAVSYPMQNRFRTGITLAMFSLIVFTLIVMAFILYNVTGVFEDTKKISGGFDISAQTSYTNPIPDIQTALKDSDNPGIDRFKAIGSITNVPIKVKQEGTDQEFVDFYLQGVDEGYTSTVTYKFGPTVAGYESPGRVWQALQDEPGTAVVSAMFVPTKANYSMGGPAPDFKLQGFTWEDESLPDVYVLAEDPRTGKVANLRIIGVLEQTALYAGGIVTSQSTVDNLIGMTLQPQGFMFQLRDGIDAEDTVKALKSQFLENGMQAEVTADEIRENTSTSLMMNNLLQGFMGLGLVVGIAALGVVAARSVVERRQQIGVLRAIGFQKTMVQFSFLLESSFIALVGIVIGIGLGMGLSVQILDTMGTFFPGIEYRIPWLNVVIVFVIAYGSSLLTTYLPARQASNVYPADALRYE